MSSLSQRRFVHPLNKKIGRRTGKAVLAGKNVRRTDDGMENFDDYFSDSDMDITREKFRLDGISEESNINYSQDSKENQSSLSNNVTSRLGSTSSIPESNNHNSMSQSVPSLIHNDTASQLKNVSSFSGRKFVHPLNKKIGRRTGKDVISHKHITLNEDGFENFDDYLSESDVSSISSRHSVSMRDTRRSSQSEYTVSSLAASSHQTNEENTKDATSNEHTELADSDGDIDSQETGTEDDVDSQEVHEDDVSSQETGTEDEVDSQEVDGDDDVNSQKTGTKDEMDSQEVDEDDTNSQETGTEDEVDSQEDDGEDDMNSQETGTEEEIDSQTAGTEDEVNSQETEDDVDEEVSSLDDNNPTVDTEHSNTAVIEQSQKSDDESVDEDVDDDDAEDNENNDDVISDKSSVTHSTQSQIVIHKSPSDQSTDDDELDNESSKCTNDQKQSKDVASRKSSSKVDNEEIKPNKENVNDKIDSENESVNSDDECSENVDHYSKNEAPNKNSKNDTQNKNSKNEAQNKNSKNETQNKNSKNETQNKTSKNETQNKNSKNGEKEHISINKTESSVKEVIKKVTPGMKITPKNVNTNKEHGESYTGNIELIDTFGKDNTGQYDSIRIHSNIDVAGNRSGSITKLERPASVVSFDRTRKRLSYSALEKSEESIIKTRERVDEANKELRKDENISSSTQSQSINKSDNPVKSSQAIKNSKPSNLSKNMKTSYNDEDDGADIMCLTSKSTKLYGDDKIYESEESESDDDIAIVDDVKKSYFVNDKGKNNKSKKDKDKSSSVSSENEIDETKKTKPSKTSKSQSNDKKLVDNLKKGNRKSNSTKEMESTSKSKKAVKRKTGEEKKKSPQEKKRKSEEEFAERSDIDESEHETNDEHLVEVDLAVDDELPQDNDVDNNDDTNSGKSNSKNETNVKGNRTKERNSKSVRGLKNKQSVSIKKLGKNSKKSMEESISKKSNKISDKNETVGKVYELNSSAEDFKVSESTKPINKSKTAKKASSSDEDKSSKSTNKSKTAKMASSSDEDKSSKSTNKSRTVKKSSSDEDKSAKSANKSRTVKRTSSSDEASPSVSKKSRKSVPSKKLESLRKNSKTKSSSSSEEDHSQKNPKLATPAVDSKVPGGHFGSGISFRVSRRSEIVDDISSGYADTVTQRLEVESAPAVGTLTPCITRPGTSRKKKGRRVTLCPEENTEHQFVKYTSFSDNAERFPHSYGGPGDSPLPSPSSTPVHIHEITKSDTPHPGTVSDEMIVDKLIKPSQPVEGLRRSSRTRLRPVAWYKNERVVFDYSKPSGPAIIGVKPSKEMIYKMAEEKKRKRRQLSYQIKKASAISNSDKSKRKLSIHFDLPEDVELDETDSHEIIVYNPFSQIEDEIDCVAKKDSSQPVGPGNQTPKKDDPYIITRLLSHPCISAGKLSIKPNALKPEHRVTADYVLFNIEYGKVLVKIHKTSTLLESGDIFMVPLGNTYSIQNLRADDARLHYSVHRHFEPDHLSEGTSLHENIVEGT